jgi:hypothetical protein
MLHLPTLIDRGWLNQAGDKIMGRQACFPVSRPSGFHSLDFFSANTYNLSFYPRKGPGAACDHLPILRSEWPQVDAANWEWMREDKIDLATGNRMRVPASNGRYRRQRAPGPGRHRRRRAEAGGGDWRYTATRLSCLGPPSSCTIAGQRRMREGRGPALGCAQTITSLGAVMRSNQFHQMDVIFVRDPQSLPFGMYRP